MTNDAPVGLESDTATPERRLLKLILEAIGEGVHGLDRDGRITFVNAAAERMLGWTAGELVGKVQHPTIHHSGADGIPSPSETCEILATIRDGRVRHRDDEVFWRRDGTSFPVDYIATPLRQGGAIIGAVIAFRDISERIALAQEQAARVAAEAVSAAMVEAHEALEARNAEIADMAQSLARINKELDQFAYIASHDLKAPLRGIASLAHWIEVDLGDKLGAESRNHLELLQTRVRRMEGLIEGILAYSRAGRLKDRRERVDVGLLLAEAIEMLAPPAEAIITVAPNMPVIETERAALQQVFMNLIGNAIRHAKRKDAHVEIAVTEEDGDYYRFSVSDNGPGIPGEFHDKIWEIFQTLEPRDRVEGTGIGLALVKKNVTARGGHAWVESLDSTGATFHFQWPKRPDREDE